MADSTDVKLTVASVLALAIVFALSAAIVFVSAARGSEQQLCHLEPMASDGWHYRTKIDGRAERCWYQGERMKPRRELYWAETPSMPPMTITAPEPEFILRWRGHPAGWDHKE